MHCYRMVFLLHSTIFIGRRKYSHFWELIEISEYSDTCYSPSLDFAFIQKIIFIVRMPTGTSDAGLPEICFVDLNEQASKRIFQ